MRRQYFKIFLFKTDMEGAARMLAALIYFIWFWGNNNFFKRNDCSSLILANLSSCFLTSKMLINIDFLSSLTAAGILDASQREKISVLLSWTGRPRSQVSVDAFGKEKFTSKNVRYLVSSRLKGRMLWIFKTCLLPFCCLFGYSICGKLLSYDCGTFRIMKFLLQSSYLIEFSVQMLLELFFSIERLHKAPYFRIF